MQINQGVVPGTPAHDRRLEAYGTYHAAIDAALEAHPQADVLSLHTFAPVYLGEPREVEVGVLFDHDAALGEAWAAELGRGPGVVRTQEPYSGLLGLMYSPQHHATLHGRRAIELEIRQDLALDPVRRAAWVERIAAAARATAAGRADGERGPASTR